MASRSEVPGVALITGAGSGIGRAVAFAFLNAGASKLALLDVSFAGLEETKTALLSLSTAQPIQIDLVQCDVSSAESVASAYAAAHAALGRIDYSVHCAGIMLFSSRSTECAVELFDRQTAVNYRGLWLCAREALKIMVSQPLDSEAYPAANINPRRAQRGAIVNISSAVAVLSMRNSPAYCAAKAAVLGLTRSDAIDYVEDRVRVNAVLPGITDSPMTNPTPEVRAWLEAGPVQRVPMKRFAMVEEIADVVLFLAGNRSSYMTGTGVPVDGGHLAT